MKLSGQNYSQKLPFGDVSTEILAQSSCRNSLESNFYFDFHVIWPSVAYVYIQHPSPTPLKVLQKANNNLSKQFQFLSYRMNLYGLKRLQKLISFVPKSILTISLKKILHERYQQAKFLKNWISTTLKTFCKPWLAHLNYFVKITISWKLFLQSLQFLASTLIESF